MGKVFWAANKLITFAIKITFFTRGILPKCQKQISYPVYYYGTCISSVHCLAFDSSTISPLMTILIIFVIRDSKFDFVCKIIFFKFKGSYIFNPVRLVRSAVCIREYSFEFINKNIGNITLLSNIYNWFFKNIM